MTIIVQMNNKVYQGSPIKPDQTSGKLCCFIGNQWYKLKQIQGGPAITFNSWGDDWGRVVPNISQVATDFPEEQTVKVRGLKYPWSKGRKCPHPLERRVYIGDDELICLACGEEVR